MNATLRLYSRPMLREPDLRRGSLRLKSQRRTAVRLGRSIRKLFTVLPKPPKVRPSPAFSIRALTFICLTHAHRPTRLGRLMLIMRPHTTALVRFPPVGSHTTLVTLLPVPGFAVGDGRA